MTRLNPAPTRRMALECLAVGMLASDLGIPRADAATAAAAPSDLAKAMAWAIQHDAWIARSGGPKGWGDERLHEEMDKSREVFRRALDEPSQSLADLGAKARFALHEYEDALFPFTDADENDRCERELDSVEQLLRVVLKEVVRLCA